MPASAKRDHCAPGKTKGVSCHVFNSDIVAKDAIRTVVDNYYCGFFLIAHSLSPLLFGAESVGHCIAPACISESMAHVLCQFSLPLFSFEQTQLPH